MTKIFILNCKKNKNLLLSLKDRISTERLNKTADTLNPNAHILSIGAEALLSLSLNLPLPINYQRNINGKPFIENQRSFNLSHSGDYVICAVSDFEVGADIEKINRMKVGTAKKFLSPREMSVAKSLPPFAVKKYLCRAWSIKESYAKLLGDGLKLPLSSICTETNPDLICFSKKHRGYYISLCLEKEDQIQLIKVSKKSLKAHFN